jgi:hypothetical protein
MEQKSMNYTSSFMYYILRLFKIFFNMKKYFFDYNARGVIIKIIIFFIFYCSVYFKDTLMCYNSLQSSISRK